MNEQKMFHQLNQIATYFEAYPQQRAREEVLDHIQKFWPPRMRTQLVSYWSTGSEGLHPLAAWAADQLANAKASA